MKFSIICMLGLTAFLMSGCGAKDDTVTDKGAATPEAKSVSPEMKSALKQAKENSKKKDL